MKQVCDTKCWLATFCTQHLPVLFFQLPPSHTSLLAENRWRKSMHHKRAKGQSFDKVPSLAFGVIEWELCWQRVMASRAEDEVNGSAVCLDWSLHTDTAATPTNERDYSLWSHPDSSNKLSFLKPPFCPEVPSQQVALPLLPVSWRTSSARWYPLLPHTPHRTLRQLCNIKWRQREQRDIK